MCIKEGLRNYSPVPFIQREFTHDFEVDGRTYPKGTPVTLHIYGLHHNKDLWEKPLSYMPERFSKENMAKMDPFQFVPFSAGPRSVTLKSFNYTMYLHSFLSLEGLDTEVMGQDYVA